MSFYSFFINFWWTTEFHVPGSNLLIGQPSSLNKPYPRFIVWVFSIVDMQVRLLIGQLSSLNKPYPRFVVLVCSTVDMRVGSYTEDPWMVTCGLMYIQSHLHEYMLLYVPDIWLQFRTNNSKANVLDLKKDNSFIYSHHYNWNPMYTPPSIFTPEKPSFVSKNNRTPSLRSHARQDSYSGFSIDVSFFSLLSEWSRARIGLQSTPFGQSLSLNRFFSLSNGVRRGFRLVIR